MLCLNGGSSSLKFTLFRLDPGEERRLVTGAVEGIGTGAGHAWVDHEGKRSDRRAAFPDAGAALAVAFELLSGSHAPEPDVVGHRVVHGGPEHTEPVVVDAAFLRSLEALVPMAPLHLPGALAAMRAVSERFPGLSQIACFDTAFHRTMPLVARRLPIPDELHEAGVRRYGFHGLSYEYVVQTMGARALGRAVIAHLGSGASMCAVQGGRSVDTTMSFTPTAGLVMGTRSGDLDPGLVVYLLDHGYDARRLERLVNDEAGLLALSERTSDMRALLAARERDPRAALAIDVFCYQARKWVGALAAAIGGLDTLVFTGGIGEHAPEVRRRICTDLAHLGITLDDGRNQAHAAIVSTDASPCRVRVVPTDEERMIARHTRRTLGSAA